MGKPRWWSAGDLDGFLGLGLNNDDVASRLSVSPLTAKTHINRAMSKLGVRNRAQLVSIAYQTGLVRSGDSHQS